MTNTTALPEPRFKMTMRVYRVDRYGSVTEGRGTVSVLNGMRHLPPVDVNPLGYCPSHRSGKPVSR